MDLGLFIGGGEAGRRDEMAACGEHSFKRRSSDGEWAKEAAPHPALQLDLKLSWPTQLGSTYQPGPPSSLAAMATTVTASVPTQGGGSANGPPKVAGSRDNYNDTGPSSSTSRSTTAGGAGGWRCSDEEGGGGGLAPRKKLRLTKEQSCYLEESFKEHATLNPKQKAAIAKKLNLRPRQVEVWFQNRRARTKLKQTEVEYEYMKRCCESLTEENRRLHREIQELRALKAAAPHLLRLHLPATTLSMCPSCERAAAKEMGGRKVVGSFTTPLKLRDGYPKMAYPVS